MYIWVTTKESYGRRLIYPACETSDILCKLAGTTTLTDQAVKYIKALGYNIKVKQKEIIVWAM